jgi:hypothetical protein
MAKRTFTFEIEDGQVTYIRDGEIVSVQPEKNFSYRQSKVVVEVFQGGKIVDLMPTKDEIRILKFGTCDPNECTLNSMDLLTSSVKVVFGVNEVLPDNTIDRHKLVLARLRNQDCSCGCSN